MFGWKHVHVPRREGCLKMFHVGLAWPTIWCTHTPTHTHTRTPTLSLTYTHTHTHTQALTLTHFFLGKSKNKFSSWKKLQFFAQVEVESKPGRGRFSSSLLLNLTWSGFRLNLELNLIESLEEFWSSLFRPSSTAETFQPISCFHRKPWIYQDPFKYSS